MNKPEKKNSGPCKAQSCFVLFLTVIVILGIGCSRPRQSMIDSVPEKTIQNPTFQSDLPQVQPTSSRLQSSAELEKEKIVIHREYGTPSPTALGSNVSSNQNPTRVPNQVALSPVVEISQSPNVDNMSRGGLLNLSSRSNIAHMDVHDEASPVLSTWGPGIVYSRLMRYSTGPDVNLPSMEVECDLCQSWDMEGNNVFVFKLRENSQWQNIDPVNGREANSEDVIFSYSRQAQSDRPNAPLLGGIASIQAVGDDGINISLSAPDSDFLLSVAHGHSKIVAPESVAKNGDLRDGPTIGTGPWVLVETSQDVMHSFQANSSYFEPEVPLVDGLDIHIISDQDTRNAAFRVGSLDIEQMDEVQWVSYYEDNPSSKFLAIPDTTMGLEISLNASIGPFTDVRVRRAVFQSIDPWSAIDSIWHGRAYLSPGFPIASSDWLVPEKDLRKYFDNPDRARELLDEIGVSQISPIEITVGDFGKLFHTHALRILDELKNVGLTADINLVNKRTYANDAWAEGNYQILVGPPAYSATPNGYLFPVLHSSGSLNSSGIHDQDLDDLIEKQSRELDTNARTQLIKLIQYKLLEDAYRFMPAAKLSIWTWSSRVMNFHPNFAGFEYSHWNRVWLKD